MMIANAPLNDIKELLGHSNIRTTQNYLHSLENENTKAGINSLL
jgi:site-specific recombinase XerD